MPPRKRTDDLADYIKTTIEALTIATNDGDEKHAPGSYKEESYGSQINHLQKHLFAMLNGDTSEHHLEHIICRAAIARLLLKQKERSEEQQNS